MIDEPVPTIPLMVPATSPTASTKRKSKGLVSGKPGRVTLILKSGVFAASRRMRIYTLASWFETAQERLLTMRVSASTANGRKLLTQHNPRRRMVAGAFLGSYLAVDAGLDQARHNCRAEQKMIEPQSGVARPAVSLVVPERVHRL